jgi:hypothetical protein
VWLIFAYNSIYFKNIGVKMGGAAARVTDKTVEINEQTGEGVIVQGSPNVFINIGWGSGKAEDVTGTALEQPPVDGDLVPKARGTAMQPTECSEGYVSRQPDDADADSTGIPDPLKIRNTTIPVDCNLNVNVTFVLNDGTDANPRPNTIVWLMSTDSLGSGAKFDGTAGTLTGTITEGTFDVSVSAQTPDGNEIDRKSFKIFAKKCDGTELYFTNPLPGGHIPPNDGYFGAPRAGGKRRHKGIDLVLPNGEIGDVVAAAPGVVLYVGKATGYGDHMTIIGHFDGNGKQTACTLYGHMSAAYVTAGDKVQQGQPIGKEGKSGNTDPGFTHMGNHLHFEIRDPGFCAGIGQRPTNFVSFPVKDPQPLIFGSGAHASTAVNTTAKPIVTTSKPDETPIPVDAPKEDPSNVDPSLPACPTQKGRGPYASDAAYISYLAGVDKKYGLPNGTLYAVMMTETGGDPKLVSPTGAVGLFQQFPAFAKDTGISPNDRYDPHVSADAAGKYISRMYKRNGGNIRYAIGGYNWGPTGALKVSKASGDLSVLSKYADPKYPDKVLAKMPNGCHITPGATPPVSDTGVGGTGTVPLTNDEMSNGCSGYNPPTTQRVDPSSPSVTPVGGDTNSTEPAIAEARSATDLGGGGSVLTTIPLPLQKNEAIAHIDTMLTDVTNPVTNVLSSAASNFMKFEAKVASNFDAFATDVVSGAKGVFGMATNTLGKYMTEAYNTLSTAGHSAASLFGVGFTGALDQVENLMNFGALIPGVLPPDVGNIIKIQSLAYSVFVKNNIQDPYDEFKNTNGLTINGIDVASNTMTDRYKDLAPTTMMVMMNHDGMDNIRNGVDNGGLQFFNDNYGI